MGTYNSKDEGHVRPSFKNTPGDAAIMCIKPGQQNKPARPKKLNAVRQWEQVKDAWNGDVRRWERYSGLKLPDDYVA